MSIYTSILVPTYNRRDSLKKLLDSILRQTFRSFEVIIIDGGSDDGTQELCQEYKTYFLLKFIRQNRKGFANAVNCGIKVASGEIVIRVDDDVILTDKWLENIVKVFMQETDAGCVTGPVITPEENLKNRDIFYFQNRFKKGNFLWQMIGKFYFDFILEGQPMAICKDFKSGAFSFGANFPECLNLDCIVEVDHPESCNMAIRRELSNKLGNFDEAFTETGEYSDSDLAYKMRYKGYKTFFNPKAILYHYPIKKGFYSARSEPFHRIINFIRFYKKHIKLNSWEKFVRFLAYLLFLNSYFFYNFIRYRDPKQLNSLFATLRGLFIPIKLL